MLGTVRNGQERFRTVPGSRGLCALLACSGIFWLSSTKSSAAENMTGTRNKDDLQETEGQEDLHTNRSTCPMTAGKQVQRRTCCGRIVCPQSAPPLACNMHDVRGPLVHFRSISQHLEHREWCEWPTEGLRNTSTCLGLHSLFFGVLCLWDARLWGRVAGGSIC